MSIELTTKSIGTEKTLFDGFCDQSIDCDMNLPDYCPDVMRILRCTVQPSVISSKLAGDRAIADGNASIRVIYSDEKNRICCYETDYPFSKHAELSTPADNAVLICSAKCDYVNCRAVSKRRIDIHGTVSLHFRVCCRADESVISSACGEEVQLKRKGIDMSSVAAVTSKCFQLSEVKNVGEGNDGIGRIVYSHASPVVTETKIIKGKILLKGELSVDVIYCSDSRENECMKLNYALPFNEIAEASELNENCIAQTNIIVQKLTAEPKTDNDGEYRYMNISADLCASVTAYEAASVSIITDVYSTRTEIEAEYKSSDFAKIQQFFNDTCMCRQSIDLKSAEPQKLFACLAGDPEYKCSFSDGKMNIVGKIPLCIIATDKDGTPVSCEREAEFEYQRTVEKCRKSFTCTPQVSVTGYSCQLSADGTADFKAELFVSAVILENSKESYLSSLTVTDGCRKKEHKSCLTVYFCSGKESLWDIARRYNTTVEEIMEENELSADYIENKSVLMIPVK